METTLSIQQIARRSGLAASALRYYEQKGFISSERRNSGHRRFPRYVLRRLAFIFFAQRLGMRLEEIKAELDKLPTDHVPTGKDWEKLTGKWTERVEAQIAQLEQLKSGLAGCIGCGCLSLKDCKIINPGDRFAEKGAGPRAWISDDASGG